ncbi:MAG TPA: phage minor capsid protein [Jatrophihabitantaceae bacterium]|nr:phage minor capsid protein [Jatrophihabitantaceae bacterium]
MTQPAAAGSAPIGPTVDALSAAVVALYAQAEQDLIASLSRVVAHRLNDTSARAELALLGQMRQAAERVVTQLALRSGPLAQRVTREAAQRGDAAAAAVIRQAIEGHPSLTAVYLAERGHRTAAAAQIGLDLAGKLDATGRGILRWTDDAYRTAVAEASTRLVLGREALTPRTAQHLAWSQLMRQGVTGYTDTRGRRWNLASYVETATRTSVQRAYNAAHEARMTSVGIDLFTVSHDGRPCPLCRPWEGVVLSNGHAGTLIRPSALTGKPVQVRVAATVEEARGAGFQHPN